MWQLLRSSLTHDAGHSFWTVLLPQIGLTQPAVKHMVIATASLVESAEYEGVTLADNMTYQTNYNKAIQLITGPYCGSLRIECVLMACLLFACCEFMLGQAEKGMIHIQAGLKIINEWCLSTFQRGIKTSNEAHLIIRSIAPIFACYIDKAPTYGVHNVTGWETLSLVAPTYELPYVKHGFTTIHQAQHGLDGIAHHVAKMVDWKHAAWAISTVDELHTLLNDWNSCFHRFETSLSEARRSRLALSLDLLRLNFTALSILLRGSACNDASGYTNSAADFKWITDKYDQFLNLWRGSGEAACRHEPGGLELHFGFIPPLFVTATKCRDLATRMAALKHLRALRTIEGNWNSCAAYTIARKIMMIESRKSSVAGQSILASDQGYVRAVEANLLPPSRYHAALNYAVFPCPGKELSLMQETIDLSACSDTSIIVWVRPVLRRDSIWN